MSFSGSQIAQARLSHDWWLTRRGFSVTARSSTSGTGRSYPETAPGSAVGVGVFAEHTQRAKGQGDWPTYERCIKLADRMWANPDAALLNALNVSYLEYLDFDGPRGPKAWSLLTPPLQEGWKAIMQYLRKLGNAARKRGAPGSDGAA